VHEGVTPEVEEHAARQPCGKKVVRRRRMGRVVQGYLG
jgi:hypothetical protein